MISTGLISMDLRLGGGIPRGAITEITGPPSSGKTALVYHLIHQAQNNPSTKRVLLINADKYYPQQFATRLHVNSYELDVLSHNKDMLECVIEVASNYDMIVIDSLPNITAEGVDYWDTQLGHALNRRMESLMYSISKSNTALIVANQHRESGTPGGRLFHHLCARRILLQKNISGLSTHTYIEYRVMKIRGMYPYNSKVIRLNFDSGIDVVDDLISVATQARIIDRAGKWLSIKLPSGQSQVLGDTSHSAISTLESDSSLYVYFWQCLQNIVNYRIGRNYLSSSLPLPQQNGLMLP